jgi:hypothetical protein
MAYASSIHNNLDSLWLKFVLVLNVALYMLKVVRAKCCCLLYLYSTVGIATRLQVGPQRVRGSNSDRVNSVSLFHNVQTASGVHPASSYPLGTVSCFSVGKAAGA